jgi:hypothetical protein
MAKTKTMAARLRRSASVWHAIEGAVFDRLVMSQTLAVQMVVIPW